VSRCTLVLGSCEAVLRDLPDCSVDAVVTDPPAGIGFMGRAWDSDKGGRDQWIAWLAGIMRECLRVLRPGGHALVWALPRTSHWTATAVEDAGFEIRDVHHHIVSRTEEGRAFLRSLDAEQRRLFMKLLNASGEASVLHHIFGTGFPKSLDVAKAGATRWKGHGTALKPAVEHWILARKPLEGTYAENVLKHGTGALNIEGCRIGTSKDVPASASRNRPAGREQWRMGDVAGGGSDPNLGRWPAHLSLDEEAARLLDEQGGERKSGQCSREYKLADRVDQASKGDERNRVMQDREASTGGASRFFYIAKPPRREKDAGLEHLPASTGGEATGRNDGAAGTRNPRAGAGRTGGARNTHPTVKAVALMRWLVRLITPPGGLVLDPFAGSGTTGIACAEEGMRFVGVEQDEKHHEIARLRLRKAYGAVATELPAQGALAAVLTAQPRAS
jgi:DNA modification methylase